MSAAEALDEFLSAGVFDDQFVVDTDEKAAWAMRKLRRAQQEADRIKAAAKAERDRINEWEASALTTPNSDAQLFDAMLVDYYRRLELDDPKLPKTYKVVGGAIQRRKNPDRVEVVDESSFVAWAQDNAPDAVALKPLVSTLKGAMWSHSGELVVSPDGEPVPGVRHVEGDERYQAKPDAP